MSKPIEDGQPCDHPGCLSHLTHPCEGCGRVGGFHVISSTIIKDFGSELKFEVDGKPWPPDVDLDALNSLIRDGVEIELEIDYVAMVVDLGDGKEIEIPIDWDPNKN